MNGKSHLRIKNYEDVLGEKAIKLQHSRNQWERSPDDAKRIAVLLRINTFWSGGHGDQTSVLN